MGISDLIASFLQDSLDTAENGVLEVQRSDLAQRFNCVPSQINYVMSTRFSPERGYIVESRRGGNGYIRITRVRVDRDARHQFAGRQCGPVLRTGNPQQPGTVRRYGPSLGSDDSHSRGGQGTGAGTARKAGRRSGGYSQAGTHITGVVSVRAHNTVK